LNPIIDICWSCIFPMSSAGQAAAFGREDPPNLAEPALRLPALRVGIKTSSGSRRGSCGDAHAVLL
jgi:hypothetical protein